MYIVTGATIALTGAITGGTTRNLSSGITESNFGRTIETADVTTYGDTDRSYLAGLRSGAISVSGLYASTYEDVISPLLGVSTGIGLKYYPHGKVSGRPALFCGVIFTDASIGAPVGDKVTMAMSMARTGSILSTKAS